MTRTSLLGAGALVVSAALALTGAGVSAGQDDSTVGGARFSVESTAGGAVWSFLEDGSLVVLGPGDLVAEGSWRAAVGDGAVDASLPIRVTDQALRILARLSPDGQRLALYVEATEPGSPADGAPWPAVSRLTGDRVGLTAEATPSPGVRPDDCLRPAWRDDGQVDWDPCGNDPDPSNESWRAADPSPSALD